MAKPKWSIEKVKKIMETHTNPSTLEGFVRKDYCGAGIADLRTNEVKDGNREFIANITTNQRDRDSEVIDPRGMDLSQFRKNAVILWAHKYDEPAIGRSEWIKAWTEPAKAGKPSLSRGLVSKGVIATGISKADEIFKLLQQKILNTVSVGFIPVSGHAPTPDDIRANPDMAEVQYIHDKTVMLEYSIVNIPSNHTATIEAVSKGLLDISVDLQNDLGIYAPLNTPPVLIKKSLPYEPTPLDGVDAGWSLSDEKSNASSPDDLKIMAAWMDTDAEESRKSYKFIHHRATTSYPVVWEGVTQAMSTLQTFQTKIPDTDRLGVWKHLAAHYREFGKEPPELIQEPQKFVISDAIRAVAIDAVPVVDAYVSGIKAEAVALAIHSIPSIAVIPETLITEEMIDAHERSLGRV